jgi:putative addiction module component (TIGR02574 family)
MILERFPGIQDLSTADKLELVSEIWDELEKDPEAFPVSDEFVKELNGLLEEYRANPAGTTTTWEAIKEKALSSRR